MAKKVTIALLSLLIGAGSVIGVTLYKNSNNTEPTEATQEVTEAVDIQIQTLSPTDATDETQATTENEKETVLDDGTNTTDITSTNFTFEKVIDHTTGEQVAPRVVFGSGFSMTDNYIKFNSDGSFEMYLSGYLPKTTKGTYVEHSDFIYVEFEDGKVYEYDIKYDDNGIICYVIVDYGDYSIYFS